MLSVTQRLRGSLGLNRTVTGLECSVSGRNWGGGGRGPWMAEQCQDRLGEFAGVSLSLCLSSVAVRLDPAVRVLAGSLHGRPDRGVDTLGPLPEVCAPVTLRSQLFSSCELSMLDRAPPR